MIRAVGRALAIFDAFDKDHLSLTLQEISERIRMPKTTAFRLVNTVERAGFLIRMDNQQYCLSLKLVRLAGMVRSTLSIRDIARPVMAEVNARTSETITLTTILNNERMVLEVVDTPSPLMSIVRPGEHMPLLYGASARILMAHMDEAELERVLKANVPSKDFDRAAFDRELARFRRQGYALTRGQRVPGLTAIAVPVFDIDGRVRNCLALTGPSVRVDAMDLDFAEIMIAAGRDLSNRLGAQVATAEEAPEAADPPRKPRTPRASKASGDTATTSRKTAPRTPAAKKTAAARQVR
ncbi:MAG: IclR family transcriptional regulator [Burkholderiales bacterium]|jgi:DNA-binding IclR family transcriptional regulator|nr:IclR family transcriptional regulator [Burkholderiales bacterium]